MDAREHLQIDLADPQDIRNKLPEAKRMHAAKRLQLENLRQQVERWETLIDSLAGVVGEEGIEESDRLNKRSPASPESIPPESTQKAAPAQERAIRALKHAGRPMGPSELYRYMDAQGMKVPSNPNALGATLWTAVKTGRAMKTPDGLYAPLDSESASRNGAHTDARTGPHGNEATGSLLTTTEPQEAS